MNKDALMYSMNIIHHLQNLSLDSNSDASLLNYSLTHYLKSVYHLEIGLMFLLTGQCASCRSIFSTQFFLSKICFCYDRTVSET